MKKYILPAIIILMLLWLVFDKVKNVGLTKEFIATQDSLVQAVDSLVKDIEEKNETIVALEELDHDLREQLENQKVKVVKIKEIIEVEKNKIDELSEVELVGSLNQRYPADTITNPLPVAQPVLVAASKDLVELDGAKQIIVLKDSSIANLEERIANKDSVVALYAKKEISYKNIMNNQQTQIKDWKFQYNTLQLENQKLKFKNKFTKIGAVVVIGGLGYLMLAK